MVRPAILKAHACRPIAMHDQEMVAHAAVISFLRVSVCDETNKLRQPDAALDACSLHPRLLQTTMRLARIEALRVGRWRRVDAAATSAEVFTVGFW